MRIIHRDLDHILVKSASRRGISHTLEKVGGKWRCTCEGATMKKVECRHIKDMTELEAIEKQVKVLMKKRQTLLAKP